MNKGKQKKYVTLSLILLMMVAAIGFTDAKGLEQLKVRANTVETTPLAAPVVDEYFKTENGVAGVSVDGNVVATSFKVLTVPKDGKNGTVEIKSEYGSTSAIDTSLSGTLAIPETVLYEGNTYDITSIGNYAFTSCFNLTSTGLQNNNTVTTIGDWAFYWCENLTSTGLESNNTVTTIGGWAFASCTELTSTGLESNNTVTTIGDYAFSRCQSLTSTGLERNDTVTTIGDWAFNWCENLTSTGLESNNTVTTIGDYAFQNCIMLDDIVLTETDFSRWGEDVFVDTHINVYYPKNARNTNTFLTTQTNWNAVRYEVDSIIVKTPSKVNYEFGDSYDPTGLVITANYIAEDKTAIPSRDIAYNDYPTDFTFDLSDNLKLTDKKVTITYGEKPITLDITVSKKKVDIPTVNGSFTENGKAHKLVDILENYDAANVILTGDIEKTAAGNYTGVATLKDPDNYEFKDSKETSISLNWVINKKSEIPDKEEDKTTDNGDKGTSNNGDRGTSDTIGRPSTTPQGDGAVVKTGDASSTRVLFALLSISMLYGCIVFIRRRKYNK